VHPTKITALLRAGGYEVLFLLAEIAIVSTRPTIRNAEYIHDDVFPRLRKRRNVPKLLNRGLVETHRRGTDEILRLTRLGRTVLDGGRHPPEAWAREWDGQWRLLTFDIPRKASTPRHRFWRWLRENHFGRLQGSVWVAPDPIVPIETIARKSGFDPANVLFFTAAASGPLAPREIASKAWDFAKINDSHRRYLKFIQRMTAEIRGTPLASARLGPILEEDLDLWRKSMRIDPLLPKTLLPRSYKGIKAWKARQDFHKTLARSLLLSETD